MFTPLIHGLVPYATETSREREAARYPASASATPSRTGSSTSRGASIATSQDRCHHHLTFLLCTERHAPAIMLTTLTPATRTNAVPQVISGGTFGTCVART